MLDHSRVTMAEGYSNNKIYPEPTAIFFYIFIFQNSAIATFARVKKMDSAEHSPTYFSAAYIN